MNEILPEKYNLIEQIMTEMGFCCSVSTVFALIVNTLKKIWLGKIYGIGLFVVYSFPLRCIREICADLSIL